MSFSDSTIVAQNWYLVCKRYRQKSNTEKITLFFSKLKKIKKILKIENATLTNDTQIPFTPNLSGIFRGSF